MIQLHSVVPKAKEKPSWKHKGTQALGLGRFSVSEVVSQDLRKKFDKDIENQEESLCLSHYDAECQKSVVAPAVGFEPTT